MVTKLQEHWKILPMLSTKIIFYRKEALDCQVSAVHRFNSWIYWGMNEKKLKLYIPGVLARVLLCGLLLLSIELNFHNFRFLCIWGKKKFTHISLTSLNTFSCHIYHKPQEDKSLWLNFMGHSIYSPVARTLCAVCVIIMGFGGQKFLIKNLLLVANSS